MVRVYIQLPNDSIDALQAAVDLIGASADEVLEAGVEVVEPRMRANLAGFLCKGSSSDHPIGQLLASLGTSPVKVVGQDRHNIKVGFAEGRRDGVSNAVLANIIEYGKSNQLARPLLAPTRSQ